MAENYEMGIWFRVAHYLTIAVFVWFGLLGCDGALGSTGWEYVFALSSGVFFLATALLTVIGTVPRKRHNFFRVSRIAAIGLNLVLIGLVVCFDVWVIIVGMRTFDLKSILMLNALFLGGGLSNCIALFLVHADRHFDPSICQKCGYDLRGSDSLRCPECGKERVDDGEN